MACRRRTESPNPSVEALQSTGRELNYMTAQQETVFIVDDDPTIRRSIQSLVQSVGLRAETFADAQEFLDAYDDSWTGCLVLDVRMPRLSGLDLQARMLAEQKRLPIIFITGFGNLAMAVRAMRAGAVDVLEKPIGAQVLLDSIHKAIEQGSQQREQQAVVRAFDIRTKRLTPREYEIMDLLVTGKHNKQVCADLGLSRRTVELHRAQVLKKMETDCVAVLVRDAVIAQAVRERFEHAHP